jgi:hypothetical protein
MEGADPERQLIGLEHRLKGCDRIKEKVADHMKEKGSTVDKALATVKDAIRYTFVYEEHRYADGVKDDIVRMESNGFEQVERRNSWESDQYKGINTRWREPVTGLMLSSSSIPRSASRRSRSRTEHTNGCVPGRSASWRNWHWKLSRRKSSAQYRFLLVPAIFLTIPKGAYVSDRISYYAIVDDFTSRERPASVFRRTYTEAGGKRDEAFTRDLIWERSASLVSYERGNLDNKFFEISEDEANRIVERIRTEVGGKD